MPTIYASRRIRNPIILLCDIQEKFRQPIHAFPALLTTTRKLLSFTSLLSLPILCTTQSRSKLGPVCSELEVSPGQKHAHLVRADIDKTLFSMCTPELLSALEEADKEAQQAPQVASPEADSAHQGETSSKRDVILCGIETHICITQTAIDLLARGYRVYIVADAVSSCNAEERGVALARLRQEGARVVSSESLMYEVLGDAGDERFRGVAGLVKESSEGTREALGALCRF